MSGASVQDVLDGYAAIADAALVTRYDALEPERIYAQVVDLMPMAGARVADIGAGTGRDAAWLARRGCDVVAVEPVRELRAAGQVLHRDPDDRSQAARAIAPMLVAGGTLILSLRHEPGSPDRHSFPSSPSETSETMDACGLRLIRQRETESVSAESRAQGVRWTWMVFEKL